MVIVNGNDHATAEEKRLKQDAKHEKVKLYNTAIELTCAVLEA